MVGQVYNGCIEGQSEKCIYWYVGVWWEIVMKMYCGRFFCISYNSSYINRGI